MNQPTLLKDHMPTSREVEKTVKPLVVKYTTHLPADMVKQIKLRAVEREVKDYQLVTQAVREFLSRQELAA
ncbi:hypothetical protein ACPXCE_09215 [Streptomyces sp. DT24]|uniref:hypothetical protein n=1 Tax=unclassified Streptomyces TaxID=2593676 RepID=UPI0023B8B65E|nr:hypothetical protein [Streptomyces sp. AM 4-1-1]WEH33618.1 hypothetical protein PZB75_09675 [Streptomyces sp. AM 4-1-1]